MARKIKTETTSSVTVTRNSAFHALGLENADELVLRSHLMRKVGEVIKSKKLSQTAIGAVIGLDQPRVSALISGKISKFSTDRLVAILNRLGHDVEIRVRPARKAHGELLVAA
jgi:predicted XRE-type DNA-binding protein